MEKLKEYTNPEYYENRELSWIKFNGRVLNEARDKSIPLLERNLSALLLQIWTNFSWYVWLL